MADYDPTGAASADTTATEVPDTSSADDLSLRESLEVAFEEPATDEVNAKPTAGERARDEAGRFIPKGERTPDPTAQAAQAQARGVTQAAPRPDPNAVAEAPPELKPPAAWKPEAREKWAGVDPSIKAEVHRREREFQMHLQQSAGLRDFVGAFESTLRPYEMFIRQEGSNPLGAIQYLMGMAAEMRIGTPHSKANMVADLVTTHGVDLRLLDAMLAQRFGLIEQGNGAAPPQGAYPQQPAQFRDPRVDQMLAMQAMAAQNAQEAEAQEIYQHAASFASSHEFFEDVRMDMADMIEMAARRGQVLTVQSAYEKACNLNEEVSKILRQREASSNAKGLTQAALRARRAAAGIKGDTTTHGSTVPANDTVRAALEAAFESSANSRM